MKDMYVFVGSPVAEDWFPDGILDVVKDAVFKYIESHPKFFAPNGDVIFDAIEMSDLVLAREELGLSKEQVPEELFVGIIPRQVGTITRKGDAAPETMSAGCVLDTRNSVLVGNAEEISKAVLKAFAEFYKLMDNVRCDDPHCDHHSHCKTPRDRAEERKKKRKKEKRRGSKT